MGTSSPQGKPEAAWPIQFTVKDLLNACWGSKKGADLLWHILNKVRWEIKNQKLSGDLKVIKFQEKPSKLLEAMKDSGHPISLGSYHSFLQCFISVGYVVSEPYSNEFEVYLEAIEKAFSCPPEKPLKDGEAPKKPRSQGFNLKDCNFVTLSKNDYDQLISFKEECFKLKEMFQSLKDYGAELKEMFQSLKHCNSCESTPVQAGEAFSEVQSNALDIEDDSDFLGASEQFSDSQTIQPTEEKKDQRIAELERQLAISQAESQRLQEKHNNQSTVSQASLIPEPPKPESTHNIPDLRAGLNERDPRQLTPAQQKRLDADEKRAEEARIKGREQELWRMVERIAGIAVETNYAIGNIKAMAKTTMPLEDIEKIMEGFAKAAKFDLTAIANYLPTYAARKKNKQPEPSNIIPFSGRYQAPQQEVRVPAMSKNFNHAGGHLNPDDYDEEPYVAVRTK